jgi:hypothetical protein
MTSGLTLAAATEAIYEALADSNRDIDLHIDALKTAMKAAAVKEAIFDPTRLVQPNREGRKMMQSYFKRRGVIVKFVGR